MEPALPNSPFHLRDWKVDPQTHCLLRNGDTVQLEPRLMKLLCLFAANAGTVLSRDTIVTQIWPDQHGAAEGVAVAIHELRKALGDNARDPQFIKTIRKAGFQLIAPVSVLQPEEAPLPISEPAEQPKETPPQITHEPSRGMRVLGLAGLVAVLLASIYLGTQTQPPVDEAQDIVAVMPFATMAGESEQNYFAEGMTEALINDLAQSTDIRVLPRRSVMRYADTTLSPEQLGRTLNVAKCVEGSVQVVGHRVMVTIQVVDTRQEDHLWARSYEKDLKDFFQIRKEASQDLVRFFRGNAPVMATVVPQRPVDVTYSYLKGKHFLDLATPGDARKAIGYFNLAVRKDPTYAEAHAGLAEAYLFFPSAGKLTPAASAEPVLRHAQQALAVNDNLADLHLVLGVHALIHQDDETKAARHLQRTLALHPTHIRGLLWSGLLALIQGRTAEADAGIAEAAALDPASRETAWYLGLYQLMRGNTDLAALHLGQTLVLAPHHLDAQLWRLLNQHEPGDDMAALLSQRIAATPPDVAEQLIVLRNHLTGGTLPEEIDAAGPALTTLAALYAAAGHTEQAGNLLKKAVAGGDPLHVFAKKLPGLTHLIP